MSWSGSAKFLLALTVATGLAAPPEARAADAPFRHAAQVATAVKMDVSPALRTITPIQGVTAEGKKAPENPPLAKQSRPLGQSGGATGFDAALQQKPGVLNMPAPAVNFEGINNVWGYYPPDTTGDVGPNHFVQWVNVGFAVYDKTGTKVYPAGAGFADGNTLWTGFGGACEANNDGDPQVNYDHLADRWVMSQFALPGPFYQCFAVSTTPDPTGPWYRYAFVVSATKMNDYPKVGVWQDGYYMTVNQFVGGSSWGGLGVFVYERDQMLVGGVARQIYFDTGAVTLNYGGALPADLDGPAPPPGTPNYVMEWDDSTWLSDPTDTLRIWEVHTDWTNPAASTFGLNASFDPNILIPTADALPLCSGNRSCISQPGTTVKLDAIGDRLMQRLQYRGVNGVPRLTTNLTVDAGGARAGVRWFQLSDTGSGWAMADQGTFAGNPGDTDNRWMGAAALDVQGNMAIGYSVASATTYPSIRYNGRLAGDPAGTVGVEENIIVGAGSQTGTANRWGDYSAMLVDPTDDCTFWYTQEYYQTTSGVGWQTRVASFKFPGCVAGPSGTIEGYVKSTVGGVAIAGAHVQVGASISTTTNAAGYYKLTVPVGTYDVTGSKFGYDPATILAQAVTDGGATVVADLLLTPVGSYGVDGFVTAADHDWPLWARIEVRQAGTLVSTVYTSPWNGYYEIAALPNGYTYDFTVHSMYVGYQDEVRAVTLASGDQVQSFSLLAADGNPAYSCTFAQGTGLNENFNGAFPPLGWTVVDNVNPGNSWKRNDAWGSSNLVTGGSGFSADADSDAAGSGSGNFDTELRTPTFTLPATPRNLKFKHNFNLLASTDRGYVDVSTDGGTVWTNLRTFTADNTTEQTIDVSAYASQSVMFRFRYTSGSWMWWWQVDDVRTSTLAGVDDVPTLICVPTEGSMVAGFVTDANTAGGLTGAQVVRDLGGVAPTMAATGNLPAGFYYMFSAAAVPLAPNGPSTRTFTASKTGYGSLAQAVNLIPNTTNRLDFSLAAGSLSWAAWPFVVDGRLTPDGLPALDKTQTFSILNSGGLAANVKVKASSLGSGYVPPVPMQPRGPLAMAPEYVAQNLRSLKGVPLLPRPAKPTPPVLAAGDVLASWATGLVFPWGVGYTDGNVWVSNLAAGGGDDYDYEFTPAGTLTGRKFLTGLGGTFPADMTQADGNGMFWQVNVGGDNCIYELDPNSGKTGNKICPAWGTSQRGVAYDPDSDTFFAGGWNDFTVTRFDRTGAILQQVNTGLAISGLAYNPDTLHLVVMTNATPNLVHVLDVANSYADLGTFSIAGFGDYSGGGIEFGCDGLWAVNQGDGKVYLVDAGESYPCNPNLPWFTMTPTEGVVPAKAGAVDGQLDFLGEFFPEGVTPSHYGLFRAQITSKNDTPVTLPAIPVYFTKAFLDVPRGHWADAFIHALAGARITRGCGSGNFCPESTLDRAEMAVTMVRAIHGPDYTPPPAAGIFADVVISDTDTTADYIEQLYNDGIVAGCAAAPLRYCPADLVNRAQMSVFIVKGLGIPVLPETGYFTDVTGSPYSWAAPYAEAIFDAGITAGCGVNLFCPATQITRAQLAVWLVKGLGIPYYTHPATP